MKKCPRCSQYLKNADFNWKVKGKTRAVYCKKCSREYIKNHYDKNREYYLKKAKKRTRVEKKKIHQFLADFLRNHPCVDCREDDILVLEFDHRDRAKKHDTVGNMLRRGFSFDKIQAEIQKCDVRCANCHRRKTQIENNSWKVTLRQ